MSITATSRRHIPDILDCLSQLSNDQVPTPPKLANAMLDLLPTEVWSDPTLRWLDPAVKSGVFLREIATRLLLGLAGWESNFEKRRDHIFRNMLYGTSIDEVTGLLARRSLYYSTRADGDRSVLRFESPDGNVPFVRTSHSFRDERCTVCGAPAALERGDDRENYAYSFTHGTYPTQELKDMKFDVIVGNPPYQIGVDGNTRTRPVYQQFVLQAIEMQPRHVLMITPSRWFTGGLGLDEFRAAMLADRRLEKMVDNPKLFDCFPGVEIKGGVSYFLWTRSHNGDCEFSVRVNGQIVSTMSRDLRKGKGVLVRSNDAETIIEKVEALGEQSISHRVSSQKPFGLLSNFSDFRAEQEPGDVRLYKRDRKPAWIDRAQITQGQDLVSPIKVLTPEAGDGHGRVPAIVTGAPFVVEGNSACTQTFLVAGAFESLVDAERYAALLRTRFARFLVHQRKASQHTTSDSYAFVPDVLG